MKKMTKLLSLLLALSMLFSLAACGPKDDPAPDETPKVTDGAPVESPDPTPTEPETPKVEAGAYMFTMTSIYGEEIKLTLMLSGDGSASVLAIYPDNSSVNYTTGWTDNGDGTFTTTAFDPALEGANFVAEDGSVKWIVDGSNVTPDGYTAPTEFVEKPGAVKDPTTNIEAEGTYIFTALNKFGSEMVYVLHLYDGVTINMWGEKAGFRTFTSKFWGMNEDGTLHIGRLVDADNPDTATPYGDWFKADDNYSSDWKLYGNHTARPVGEEFDAFCGNYDYTSVVPAEMLEKMNIPEFYEESGIKIFTALNKFGSEMLYVLHLTNDGVTINMWGEKAGFRTFTGKYWGMTEEGYLHLGRLKDADNPDTATPYGDWFNPDDNYSSDWVVFDNGTCRPLGEQWDANCGNYDYNSVVPAEMLEKMLP